MLGSVRHGPGYHIAATYPLADAAQAVAASKQGHARGKVVITVP